MNQNKRNNLAEIELEHDKAKKFYSADFGNFHEAYAVIKEEIDELWDEIKAYKYFPKDSEQDKQNLVIKAKIRKEAIQSAAMLLRLLNELC